MSKNNFDERLRKMQPKKDHYSIRKFSVGVASVLIGFSFLGLSDSPVVKADTSQESTEAVQSKASPTAQQKSTAVNAQKNLDQGKVPTDDSQTKQTLTKIQAAAVKAMQNQQAINTKAKLNASATKSAPQINKLIGLAGRSDVKVANTDNQSAKSVQSDRSQNVAQTNNAINNSEQKVNSANQIQESDKKSQIKQNVAGNNNIENNQSRSSKDVSVVAQKQADYSVDTQSLNDNLPASSIRTEKIAKSRDANPADKLANELNASAVVEKNGNLSKLILKGVNNDSKLAYGSEQTLNINKTAGLDAKNKALLLESEKVPDLQTKTASTWQELADAINNKNVGQINLTGDITVKGVPLFSSNPSVDEPNHVANPAKLQFKGKGIARKLIISGKNENGKNFTLDFNSHYWSFTDNNQNDSKNNAWDLIFENINIKDEGITSGTYEGGFAPIYFGDDLSDKNAQADTVTFDGVTANVTNGPVISGSMHAAGHMSGAPADKSEETVVLKDNNVINNDNVNLDSNALYNYGSTISAGRVVVENGTTTINVGTAKTNNADNYGGNAIYTGLGDVKDSKGNVTQASVWIKSGATLTINGGYTDLSNVKHNGTDVRGIVVNQYNSNDGTVQVDGIYNANMADGHSNAITAANLNISQNGSVTIHTAQDNEANGTENSVTNQNNNYNGTHYAPITLGVNHERDQVPASWAKNNLIDNGSLTIIRNNTNKKTMTPLISIGIGTGALGGATNYATYNMTVGKGATLDLEDNSIPMNNAALGNTGHYNNTPKHGLITMWGDAANSTLNFDDPQYVNLQRTGSSTGGLILIQQSSNKNNSSVNLTGTVPVAQWDEGNKTAGPSFVWYIKNLKTWNHPGDHANTGFTQAGEKGNGSITQDGTDSLINSNAQVTMGENQSGKDSYEYDGSLGDGQRVVQGTPSTGNFASYYLPYLNQFLNDFSWWKPQRLTFGEKKDSQETPTINDAQKYQPEVQTINGTTNQKLSDLKVNKGIVDLIGPDGNKTTDLSSIDWTKTHWYDSTKDSTNWSKIMGSGQNPVAAATNSDGTLKVTPPNSNNSNTATVVYTDGSIDFVNIPIKVTAPSDSDTYNSHYQGTKAEKGKETDVPSPTIKKTSDGTIAPNDINKNTSYSAVTSGSDQTPSWVTVNSDDGSLKLNPGDNVTVGMKNIPIQVKYGDGSSEVTDAPVYISDGTHSVIWGHDANGNTIGAVVLVTDPSKLNAHETSDNSQVLTPADAFTDIEEYTVADNGKATLAGHLDKSKVKISWEEAKAPNTVVTTPSKTGSTSGTLHVDLNGQANTYLGNDSGSVFEDNMTIPMVGAIAKNPSTPVNVGFNTKLTKDEFNDLIDNNIPADEIAGYAWHNADGTDTLPEKATTAIIRITFKDKDKNGNPTYLDIKLPANSIKVTSDADHYTVAYGDMKVARPNDDSTNSESEEPTVTPSTVPAGTISNYAIDSSFTNPTGVTISVDKNGKITATANKNAILGSFKVPVNVTYADTSTAKVNVTVSVTGFDKDPHGGNTHYYGDQTMLTFGLPVITVHKTTGTNIYDASQIKFDTICYYYNWSGQGYDASAYKNHTIYKLNADRTKYVNEDDSTDTFNASDLHTSWRTVGGYTYQADTDESKFSDGTASTKYKNKDGSFNTEEQTAVGGTLPENLAGNSKYRFNFSFEGSDVPSGIEVPDGIWSNVYFNFLGAKGKTGIPVNVGDTVPTSAKNIEKYLSSNDVGTPGASADNKWQVTNISWEKNGEPGTDGKFDASHTDGIVRFDFKDVNGNTSCLDVKVKFVTGKYIDPADHNKADDPLYSQTHANATRTITYDVSGTGHAAIEDETQTVNYIRDGYEHFGSDGKADGTYIWNSWKPASTADENYPSKQVQQIDGYNSQVNGQPGEYTPKTAVVLDKDGKPENGDIVKVTYSAKLSEDINFTQDITYVDAQGTQIKNGNISNAISGSFKHNGSYTVTAATEKKAINDHIPAGWVIADSYTYPSDETIKSATPNAIKVTVKHGSKLINPGDKIPQGSDPTKGEPNKDVDPTDSQHTLKRIITVTDPSGNKNTVEQDIDFQRTGHIDTVNGNVTWDSWKPVDSTKDSFAEYDAPAIDGYTSGKASAENKVSYTDGKQDEKVAIGYTANPQSVAIKFVDDDNNGSQVGETITKNGVTGGTLNETDLNDVKVPTHYELASGQQLPTSYTFTAKKDQNITIHLVHKIDKDLDQNHIPKGALNPDGKTSTQKSDFSEDVKRTITAEKPSGNADLIQTVTLTRTGNYDEVTKKMSWNAWTTGTFAEVDAPIVAGYTSSPTSIAADTAKDGYVDPKIKITYSANNQNIKYQFVDDNRGGEAVGDPVEVDGKTDETVDPSQTVKIPAGYQLATGESIPVSYKFGPTSPKDSVEIHLVHGSKKINPGDKIPAGTDPSKGQPKKDVDPTDSQHTLKRVITVTKSDGSTYTETQSIEFQRTGHIDTVTGDVTWDKWTPADPAKDSFDTYTAPAIDGYTSGKVDAIIGVTYKDGDQDLTAAVGYTAKDQSMIYKFWDDTDKKEIGNDHVLSGKTDQTIDTDLTAPAGYDLVSGNTIPTKYTFKASGNDAVTIHFTHHIDKNITKTPTGGAKDPTGKEVKDTDFSETVKRTITAKEPQADGTIKDVDLSQTATLTRTGNYDEVTKVITWNAWSKGSFDAVNAPTVAGYTPDKATIPAVASVTDGYKDPNITITYTAGKHKMVYTFVDDDEGGTTVDTPITINGDTNQTVNTGLTVPDGYKLATGTDSATDIYDLPANYKFGSTDAAVKIHLVHKIDKGISKDQNPSDSKTSADDFSEKVKRTITAHIPTTNGVAAHDQDLSESVTLTRTGDYDEATKKIVNWNPWSTGTFEAVTAPTVAGYKPSQSSIAAATAQDGYVDPKIEINYSASDQSMTYKYWDDTENKEIGNDHVLSGKTDQTIDTNLIVPAGYDLVSGNTIPTKYTFKASGNDAVTIHFTHHIDKNITKTPTGGAKDPTGKEVKDTDFSETVKRTITAKEPQADGTTKDVDLSQSVTLTRTGDFDEVTKVITWNAWSTGTFDAVTAPKVDGYDPSPSSVASETAEDGYVDPKIKIAYTANGQKMVYTYWDDTDNKKIPSTEADGNYTISGKTGDTVSTGLVTPAGYQLAEGQTLPKSYTLTSAKDQSATIHFIHKIDKGISKDQNPSDSKTSADDFSEEVKRTITAHIPTTNGVAAHDQDLSETVTLTRTGDYDEALKKIVTWNPWSTGTFEAVNAPTVAGYTASPSSVASETAKDGYNDPKIEITYTPNGADSRKMVYTYWDDTDNKKIPSTEADGNYTISGKTGDTVSTGLVIPAGYQLAEGETLPTSYKLTSSNDQSATIHFVHKTRTVEPGEVPTPDSKISGDNGHKIPGDGKPTNDITYNDLHKDITRTITVDTPNATPTVITQTVSYERDATIDDVTGNVKYGDWTVDPASKEQSLTEYDVPSVSGYAPSQNKVEAETPTSAQVNNWSDPKIVITYAKQSSGNGGGNEQPTPPTPQGQIIIKYVDPNGKTVGTVIVPVAKGSTTDPSGAIKSNVPKGYKLPDGYTAPTSASEGATISVSVVPITNSNNNSNNNKQPTPPIPKKHHESHKTANNHKSSRRKHSISSKKNNHISNNAVKGEKNKWSHNGPVIGERTPDSNRNHVVRSEQAPENSNYGTHNINIAAQGESGSEYANGQKISNSQNRNAKTLPQTGSNRQKMSAATLLGMAVALTASLFGLGGDKRKQK